MGGLYILNPFIGFQMAVIGGKLAGVGVRVQRNQQLGTWGWASSTVGQYSAKSMIMRHLVSGNLPNLVTKDRFAGVVLVRKWS